MSESAKTETNISLMEVIEKKKNTPETSRNSVVKTKLNFFSLFLVQRIFKQTLLVANNLHLETKSVDNCRFYENFSEKISYLEETFSKMEGRKEEKGRRTDWWVDGWNDKRKEGKTGRLLDRWMNRRKGWIEERTDGWMDRGKGWMKGRMAGWIDERKDRHAQTKERMDGRIKGRRKGLMDGRIDRQMDRWMGRWMD